MSLELFKTCKLLTGDIGLTNEVDSAMVLEALDIENWSKKNQLILTSLYAFKDLPTADLINFFQKMKNLGVSGLVVKMDRLITVLPDWLVTLCFEHQIPLIKVEQEISYEKIMLTIYEPLLNHQGHLLRTYYDVRQRFTKVERNLHSFEQIMETFYQLIQLPCTLSIPALSLDIHKGPSFEQYIVQKKDYIETNEFTKNYYERLNLFSLDSSQQATALQTEITTRFGSPCTLIVYQLKQTIEASHMMIIENVIDIIHERLQMEYLLKKERYARMNNLADAILQNTPTSLDELNSLLEEAKMNHFRYYQGITFSAKAGETYPHNSEILTRLYALRSNTIFFEHYNYTVILYNLEKMEQEIKKEEIKKIIDATTLESEEITISFSLVKEKGELKEILLECLDAIRFNQHFHIDPIVSINDLGIFRYFMRENQAEQLEKLVPPQLHLLWEKHEELFLTLYTFFQVGRNYKKTAETLFLHSKTIRYRLNKIEHLLNIDLTNPIQLVNYEIGTYLLKTKRRDK
jgi:purine catabolism regulator